MSILPFEEDGAKGRQALILDEMVEQGYITKQQATLAKKEPLTFASLDTKSSRGRTIFPRCCTSFAPS